jgi:hypothetical protein
MSYIKGEWYGWFITHKQADTHSYLLSWSHYAWTVYGSHHDFDTHDAIMMLIPMTPSWFWYTWRHHDFDTHDAIMILTPMTPSWFWYPWPWTCSVCCSHNPVLLHSRIITEFWTIEIRRVTYKQIIYPSEVPEFTPGFLVEITLPNL